VLRRQGRVLLGHDDLVNYSSVFLYSTGEVRTHGAGPRARGRTLLCCFLLSYEEEVVVVVVEDY